MIPFESICVCNSFPLFSDPLFPAACAQMKLKKCPENAGCCRLWYGMENYYGLEYLVILVWRGGGGQ